MTPYVATSARGTGRGLIISWVWRAVTVGPRPTVRLRHPMIIIIIKLLPKAINIASPVVSCFESSATS